MWVLFSVLSAVFAALTSVFAKIGLADVNSHLATAIRTIVVLAAAWAIVFVTGGWQGIHKLSVQNIIFLILSGLATGASWLFYFKALQMGDVTKVMSVDKLSIVFALIMSAFILGEKADIKSITGCALITAGALFMIF